ncbi:PhzF family phenazine biosynthesis protein [Embleya sp. NPDC056575]|uniref:PhzF family phenazine biosynthesis protein n=1 Tax=unclassified Embleya TaxID=2699296 RepID=UPI00367AB00C
MIGYELVNMFTDRPFAGSALAVVPDATGLSSAVMRCVAAELGAAETAFVLPATSPHASYRVRVFGPDAESPHGAHSGVGTAATLARLGRVPTGRLMQECGTGRQVLAARADRATLYATGPVRGEPLDRQPLLDAVGLTEADLADADGDGGPRLAGFGGGFAVLPVRADAIARARPDYAHMRDVALPALCLFTWEPADRLARARLFAPGFGIPEDPACGPVAMALGGWLIVAGRLPATNGEHGYTVRQGAEAGRPALLECTVTVENGLVVRGSVTGRVTPVASGHLADPVESP